MPSHRLQRHYRRVRLVIRRSARCCVDAHADDTAEPDVAGDAGAPADFRGRTRPPAVL